MKKYVAVLQVKVRVIVNDFDDPVLILDEMDYSFSSDRAEIEMEILDYEFVE